MTTPPGNPAPGWYTDPAGGGGYRYWDGLNWTDPAPPGAPTAFPITGSVRPSVGVQPAPKATMSGKKIALIAGGIVVALGAIGSIAGGEDKAKPEASSSSSPSRSPVYTQTITQSTPAAPKTETIAAPGSAVRDGKFEFTVLGVERSASKEGMFNPEQAKGEFFTVTLQVTNVGDDARTFFADNQHLIINGNKYDATSSLSDKSWSEELNPGLGSQVKVTFDIPPGAVPEAIECHDSAFSGGALLGL